MDDKNKNYSLGKYKKNSRIKIEKKNRNLLSPYALLSLYKNKFLFNGKAWIFQQLQLP